MQELVSRHRRLLQRQGKNRWVVSLSPRPEGHSNHDSLAKGDFRPSSTSYKIAQVFVPNLVYVVLEVVVCDRDKVHKRSRYDIVTEMLKSGRRSRYLDCLET